MRSEDADAVEDPTLRARLEWWRRIAFMFIGVVIAGAGWWLADLSDRVVDNAASLSGVRAEIITLRDAIDSNTAAQQATTLQLAVLSAKLETIETLRSPERSER